MAVVPIIIPTVIVVVIVIVVAVFEIAQAVPNLHTGPVLFAARGPVDLMIQNLAGGDIIDRLDLLGATDGLDLDLGRPPFHLDPAVALLLQVGNQRVGIHRRQRHATPDAEACGHHHQFHH